MYGDGPSRVREDVDGELARVAWDDAGNGVVSLDVVGEVLEKATKLGVIDHGGFRNGCTPVMKRTTSWNERLGTNSVTAKGALGQGG